MSLKDSKGLIDEIAIRREILKRKAKSGDFMSMIYYIDSAYKAAKHHKILAKKLEQFLLDPNAKKNIAVFMPPQHGKSELTTRKFPCFALGMNPDAKIAVISYSADLADSFNRSIQRCMDSDEYRDIFPESKLNSKNVVTTQSWLRNSEIFEIVDHKGFLKSVGITGGLSGVPVDIAIIDDPIKDDIEAQSPTYRERVWNAYISVILARLHNDSRQILIMTRWHEDDLGGRLLDPNINPNYKDWEVLKFEAIKETESEYDDREIGEALWPERHSLDKLTKYRALSEETFQALCQQNPVPRGGFRLKKDRFKIVDELPVKYAKQTLFVDGAYTDKTKNDPSGLLPCVFEPRTKTLYITNFVNQRMEMPELLTFLDDFIRANNVSSSYVEPKASGKSIKQMMGKIGHPFIEIASSLVNEGKEARFSKAQTYIESGKIVLVRGPWNDAYMSQMTSFPKAKHDEAVDLTGYAADHFFKGSNNIFDSFRSMDNLI